MARKREAVGLPLRPLGRTGLRVSPICMGGAILSGALTNAFQYEVPEERALATIRRGFQGPLNFLDTAAAYGNGESERRFGLVLRELGGLPAGIVLATKADRDLETRDFSGDQAHRSIERSLRLLGLERLQLVYLHDTEYAATSFEEIVGPGGALEVLQRLKEQGLIQHLGIATGPLPLLQRYVELGVFEVLLTHNRYTLLNRSAEPLIELAAQRGIAVVNGAPYATGILAKGPATHPRYVYREAPAEVLERARRIEDACRRLGVPLAAAALQFSLRDPRISSTVVGMSHPGRVAETLALAAYPIPAELWPLLETLVVDEGDPQVRRA